MAHSLHSSSSWACRASWLTGAKAPAHASRHSDDTQRTLFELSPFSVPAAQRFIEDSRLSITNSAALVAEAASVDSESDLLRQATTAELSTETKLPARRIEDYLSRLDESGLIRRLSDTPTRWEIAHDFIAKLLNNLIGSREGHAGRILKRIALTAIPLLAAAVIIFAVPLWQKQRAHEIWGLTFRGITRIKPPYG